MSKIIDLTEILKKKNLETVTEMPEYYKRFLKCEQNALLNGLCNCDVCLKKDEISTELLRLGIDLVTQYTEQGGEPLYWGDLLEIMVMSTLKTKELCNKDIKDET